MDLQEKYKKSVITALQQKFGYTNVMAIPKIEKVVVNVGVGRMRDNSEQEEVRKYLTAIAGQYMRPRPARKAIASFKTRIGLVVGYATTLRGKKMYDFLTRLVDIALPRTRDFHGLNLSAVDGNGNLTIGIKEHIVFPELIGEDYKFLFGFEVTIVSSAKTRDEGIELFRLMGFPLKPIENKE